jgi:hypothetical protein
VLELPVDLVVRSVGLLRGGQGRSSHGVRGRTEGVRAHVGHTGGLRGGAGGRYSGGGGHIARRTASDESTANLFSGTELAAAESARSSDRVSWTIIVRSLCFEQAEDSVGAVRRPHRNNATIGFAQSLQRNHTSTISRVRVGLHVCVDSVAPCK